jgi:putative acetyltransferase
LKLKDITYRRAQTGDSELIKRILKTTLAEYNINLPENYSFADIENLEEDYLKSGGEFMVLLREQKIIGFFALRPSGNNQIELKRLYLKADERGRGLGRHLLNMALKIAKESGYVRIHLETTSKFIEAVALYRKFGFKTNVGATLSQGHEIGLKRDL